MAKQAVKSALASKYKNADAAVKAHGKDQTTTGIINLPGGIKNGIAQVSKCYFKQFDKGTNMKRADGSSAEGEYFFRCEGTVNTPKSVATPDGVIPVEGLTTSKMIPFFDTKNSKQEIIPQEKHIADILNVMRQLMGDEYTHDASVEDLEALAAGIEEAAPYFRFSTNQSNPSKEYPNPMVFEQWHGGKGLENYQPENAPAMSPAPSTNGHANTFPNSPTIQQGNHTMAGKKEDKEESLDELVSLAGSDADSAIVAREKLEALAMEAGWSEDEVKNADSWEQVKEMIENGKQEETKVEKPTVGMTVKYTPPGKDKNKKDFQERECEVTKVNEKKETVNLKDPTNKKTYEDVEWSELS